MQICSYRKGNTIRLAVERLDANNVSCLSSKRKSFAPAAKIYCYFSAIFQAIYIYILALRVHCWKGQTIDEEVWLQPCTSHGRFINMCFQVWYQEQQKRIIYEKKIDKNCSNKPFEEHHHTTTIYVWKSVQPHIKSPFSFITSNPKHTEARKGTNELELR